MNRILFVLLVLASQLMRAEDAALPVEVSASDPKIAYVGRFDFRDAKGPRCAWPASSAVLKFKGTAADVTLNEMGGNQYQVVLDGKPVKVLSPRKGEGVYTLATGLPDGEHTVEVIKRTEASIGVTQFMGFHLGTGAQALDPAKVAFRLEVIGDSISCGYGNEGKSQNEHFKNETENAYLTYGAIAARALNAEYVCIAWSGKKMWPNDTIPELYDRALPNDKSSTWDFAKWAPDVVLINLATNDFGKGNPDEKGWTGAYKTFIVRLRKNYPKALIYCASGSMMSDSWPAGQKAVTTLHRYLDSIIEDLKQSGETRVRFLAFEPQDMKNGLGSDWHPSVKTHEIMAAKLVEAVKKDLGQ